MTIIRRVTVHEGSGGRFESSTGSEVQFDRVRPNKGSGLLIYAQPGYKGPVTVGAVALDFVF